MLYALGIALLLALSQNDAASPPSLFFEGHIVTMRGHELGYLRPSEGARVTLDLENLDKLDRKIDFARDDNTVRDAVPSYVPLPASFRLIDVEGGKTVKEWSSLRAVAENGHHRVTLDAVRKPGRGSPGATEVWLLIESGDRITGVVEIRGEVRER